MAHASVEIFVFESDGHLKDPMRLERICRSTSGRLALIGKIMTSSSLVPLSVAGALLYARAAGWIEDDASWTRIFRESEQFWGLLGISGGFGIMLLGLGLGLLREGLSDPLREFLKSPGKFSFFRGQISTAVFLPSDARSLGEVMVRGTLKDELGRESLLLEKFRSAGWPFGHGKQLIPPTAWAIAHANNPARLALIGIPRAEIEKAVQARKGQGLPWR